MARSGCPLSLHESVPSSSLSTKSFGGLGECEAADHQRVFPWASPFCDAQGSVCPFKEQSFNRASSPLSQRVTQ